MLINFYIRKSARASLIESAVRFYVKHLNLENSRRELSVMIRRGQAPETGAAAVTVEHDGGIVVCIDSRLGMMPLMIAIAHEMVHVKQICSGLLKHIGGEIVTWRGVEMTDTEYAKRPWEIQAYAKQGVLVQQLLLSAQ